MSRKPGLTRSGCGQAGTYFGVQLNDQTLVPDDDARIGATRFEDWLSDSKSQKPAPKAAPSRTPASAA